MFATPPPPSIINLPFAIIVAKIGSQIDAAVPQINRQGYLEFERAASVCFSLNADYECFEWSRWIFSFSNKHADLVLAQIHFLAALTGESYAGIALDLMARGKKILCLLLMHLLRRRFELRPGGEDGKTKVSIALAQRDLSASRLQIGVGRKQLAALHRPSGDFALPKEVIKQFYAWLNQAWSWEHVQIRRPSHFSCFISSTCPISARFRLCAARLLINIHAKLNLVS